MRAALSRFAAFLTRLNTHGTFWTGVIAGTTSLLFIGARAAGFANWATAHLDGFAGVACAFVDGAATVGLAVIWPALMVAAFGRPFNIPGPK